MSVVTEHIEPRWKGEVCIVAAPGPSLTPDVAQACYGDRIIAVNDAYRLMPFADVLYAADKAWWEVRDGAKTFPGEKWTCHEDAKHAGSNADKSAIAGKYGLRLVRGKGRSVFSTDPNIIHYGGNSGFQGVNLAILFGAARIVLVGFDMRRVNGRGHFFGEHEKPLRPNSNYDGFIRHFTTASRKLPSGVKIVNATPGSALTCFPFVEFNTVPMEMAA